MSPLMNRRRLLLSAVSAAGLAACSSDPVPRDAFYRLGKPAAPQTRAGGPIKGVLEVPPLRAAGIVNERAILYRDAPRQLMQYSYHAWVESPTAMLQRSLVDVLRQAQAFDVVVTPEMRTDREFELVGTLLQWEHVRPESAAVIEMEIAVRRVRGNQQLLLKTYRTSAPTAGNGIGAVVDAFTHGLDTIYKDFIADLAAVKL